MALKLKKPVAEVEVSPVIEPVGVALHKAMVEAEATAVESLTEEYLALHKKYLYFEVKEMTKRMEDIRKHLQTVANDTMDESQPAIFSCKTGEIEFSERGKTAHILDPLGLVQELLTKFGPEVTASVVNVALTPLRKLLSEFELKKHLKEQPGTRTLRSVRPTG